MVFLNMNGHGQSMHHMHLLEEDAIEGSQEIDRDIECDIGNEIDVKFAKR